MDELLRDIEAFALLVQDCAVRHAHIIQPHFRVVAGHVERPVIVEDLDPRRGHRDDERGDALAVAILA